MNLSLNLAVCLVILVSQLPGEEASPLLGKRALSDELVNGLMDRTVFRKRRQSDTTTVESVTKSKASIESSMESDEEFLNCTISADANESNSTESDSSSESASHSKEDVHGTSASKESSSSSSSSSSESNSASKEKCRKVRATGSSSSSSSSEESDSKNEGGSHSEEDVVAVTDPAVEITN